MFENLDDKIIDRLIDIVDLFIGFVSGVLIAVLTFLLSYRHSLRNRLTGEFTAQFKCDFAETMIDPQTNIKKINRLRFKFYINCSNPEGCHINYIYLRLPNEIKGNSLSSATVGEMLFQKGFFYVAESPEFRGYLSSDFFLPEPILIQLFQKHLWPKLYIVVSTNKYGRVRSNPVQLSDYINDYNYNSWWGKFIPMFFKI